jgi:DNA polymerase epsilon subunit 3
MAERPEDLNLPASIVTRIVKDALPSQPSVKVSKEASTAIAKAASVFVLYATSCASTVAQNAHRKTITGNDVIRVISIIKFRVKTKVLIS